MNAPHEPPRPAPNKISVERPLTPELVPDFILPYV